MKLKAISSGPHCDIASCHEGWDVRLGAGASLLNLRRDVRLCDTHWKAWLKEESGLRARDLNSYPPHNERP